VEEEEAAVEIAGGVRELAEEPGEQNVGALVVLLRMKDKALARRSQLSTATARWRPSRAPGSRGARKRGQRGEGRGLGQGEDDAWKLIQQEVARRRRQSSGQGQALPAAGSRTRARGRRREGRGSGGLFGNLRNSKDLSVN
jgi:hypothetical protein